MYYLIFLSELILLFILSRFVTRAVSHLFYTLFRHEGWAITCFAILFFPGTLIHELAHFFMAIILFVRVGEIEFVPKIREGSVKLGSVQIGHTDPFRRALIGLAPIFVGIALLAWGVYFFSQFPIQPQWINILIVFFIVFEIGNTMFSSKRDVDGLLPLLIVLAVFSLIIYLLGFRIPPVVIQYFSSNQIVEFTQQLCLYLLVPIGLDLIIVGISKVARKQ